MNSLNLPVYLLMVATLCYQTQKIIKTSIKLKIVDTEELKKKYQLYEKLTNDEIKNISITCESKLKKQLICLYLTLIGISALLMPIWKNLLI